MFAAPLELWTKWDPRGVPGTHRFLSRVWNLVQEYSQATVENKISDESSQEILRSTHKMIQKVTADLEKNHYNTAIAVMMQTTNDFFKLKVDSPISRVTPWKEGLEGLVMCLAPFAPHIADELWFELGHSDSVHRDHWPTCNEKYLVSETINIVVQVNGKLRANVRVPADATETIIVETAKANSKVSEYINKKELRKTIYVPQKLVNFVA